MADVLKFHEVGRQPAAWHRGRQARRPMAADEAYSFWPEIECGRWTGPAGPANSPKRVFPEICAILGTLALVVLLASQFAPSA